MIQVMAWCRHATSHCFNQCWASSITLYGFNMTHWFQTCDPLFRTLITKYMKHTDILRHRVRGSCSHFGQGMQLLNNELIRLNIKLDFIEHVLCGIQSLTTCVWEFFVYIIRIISIYLSFQHVINNPDLTVAMETLKWLVANVYRNTIHCC